MEPAATDTLIGERIFGGYIVTERIGAGGMGAVYLAENRSLGRKLAVKVLLTERSHSAHAVARFLAEAKAASAIQHRNIIDVIDAAELSDGRHYILMEFLPGKTLRQFARAHHPLTLEIILAILSQVCAGLQAAHERGIIHRDLKPSNIFISPQPDNPYFTKLLDFGIAKLAAPDLTSDAHTKSRTIAGTPYYMSPEQARALRDVDHRTDIYAIGVIAYELLTGKPPYMAASAGDLVYQQQTMVPTPPNQICRGLPDAWNRLILETIHLDANRRPQTARELATRLIESTEGGMDIARATAPLLFASRTSDSGTNAPSQPNQLFARLPSYASAPVVIPTGPGAPKPRPTGTVDSPAIRSGASADSGDVAPESGIAASSRGLGDISGPARPPRTMGSSPARPSMTAEPSLQSAVSSGGAPDPADAQRFPVTTRNLRSPSGGSMVAEPVPTTLGMTASEVTSIHHDGSLSGSGRRPTGGRIALVLSLLGLTAFAVTFLAVSNPGFLGGDGDDAGTVPAVEPIEESPTIHTEDTRALAPADAGSQAATIAPADAAIHAMDPDAGVDAGIQVDTKPRNRNRRITRRRGNQRPSRSIDAGAVPETDDDLFKDRK